MTTGPGAVPRLGGPVAHQSATARGVACVVGGVLVRELGGRWGAWRLDAAGFTARCAVHGACGGDSHGVSGEHAMAAGGPAGGGAAVEALAGLIAREGVAGVHDVLEHLEGRDRIPRVFGEARGQEGVAGGGGGDLVASVVSLVACAAD